jgi:hypothetical protein
MHAQESSRAQQARMQAARALHGIDAAMVAEVPDFEILIGPIQF